MRETEITAAAKAAKHLLEEVYKQLRPSPQSNHGPAPTQAEADALLQLCATLAVAAAVLLTGQQEEE